MTLADQARRDPLATAAAPTGVITSVQAGIVRGWVSTADPRRLLALFVGRRRIATTRLADADGDARIAFAFDARGCPPDLLARPTLVFDVAILGEPSGRLASFEVSSDAFLSLEDLAPRPGSLEGCVDQLTDGLLRGWVRVHSRPERRLDLFVFADKHYLGHYVAKRPRPDLAASGRGDGFYGFEIPLAPENAASVVVVAGDPEYWRIPSGAHALRRMRARKRPRRDLHGSVEAFARALTTTEPFPKKTFQLDKVKRGAVPDAFSADYVALSLECLRHEMVATGEAMGGGWWSQLRSWAEMRAIGVRIRRLEELAGAITDGPRLVQASARRRNLEAG